MKVKKIVYILIGSIILVYLLFCTGVPKSELYGIYTNDYKNHRDTIWLYPEGKGEQKIYDKNNLLVYSYKFEWTYKYAIPRSWATITINGITVPYDVDYTDSLYLPAEQFRFEPMYYSGLQFDKRNDTIMLLTENLPNVEYNQYFHKISEISTAQGRLSVDSSTLTNQNILVQRIVCRRKVLPLQHGKETFFIRL